VSTHKALGVGAVEANLMMAPFAGSPLALAAVKAGVTSATIVATERMWKKNREAAQQRRWPAWRRSSGLQLRRRKSKVRVVE